MNLYGQAHWHLINQGTGALGRPKSAEPTHSEDRAHGSICQCLPEKLIFTLACSPGDAKGVQVASILFKMRRTALPMR